MNNDIDLRAVAITELLAIIAEQSSDSETIANLREKVVSLEERVATLDADLATTKNRLISAQEYILAAETAGQQDQNAKLSAIEKQLGALGRIEKAIADSPAPVPPKDPPKEIKVIPIRDAADRILHYVMREES